MILKKNLSLLIFLSLSLLWVVSSSTSASSFTDSQGGAQYYVYLGGESELQINVNIWGRVLKPGMYSIPKTMDLIALISLAGGPVEDANLSRVRIIRGGASSPHKVITINVKKYLENGDNQAIPILEPGDTVEVPPTSFHGFSRFLQFVAQVAFISSAYWAIFGNQ